MASGKTCALGRILFPVHGGVQSHCDRRRNTAPVAEDPVERLLQPGLQTPADAAVLHADFDPTVISIGNPGISEKDAHDRRIRGDLTADRIAVGLHQLPGRILRGQRIVLLKIDLDPAALKELLLHLLLHAEDPLLVDQVIGTQADLEPCPLPVGGQAFHLRIRKIILQISPDL